MLSALKKFRNKESVCIYFNELDTFEVGEIIQINEDIHGSIECERLHNKGNNLMFRVEMKKGEQWEIHTHDCKETLLVYKGELLDEVTGCKANKAKVLTFKPGKEHLVKSLSDSIFYVEFQKVNK